MKIKILKDGCFEHNGKHTVYKADTVHELENQLASKIINHGYGEEVFVGALIIDDPLLKIEQKTAEELAETALTSLTPKQSLIYNQKKAFGGKLKNKMINSERNKDGV